MDLLTTVDQAARGTILLFGSPPPKGRDLDLLVRQEDERLVVEALRVNHFLQHGEQWVRFTGCTAESADIVPAASWALPPSELQALFSAAVALDGTENVVRPAPHHVLLILARQFAASDGRLPEKRRARIDEAVSLDPRAWDKARDHAPLWGAVRAVRLLESSYRNGQRAPLIGKVGATAESFRTRGAGGMESWTAATRIVCFTRRRGVLIALSGVDRATTAAQVQALKEPLERLTDHPVVVSIDAAGSETTPGGDAARPGAARPRNTAPRGRAEGDAGARDRRRREANLLMVYVWAIVLAITEALALRRRIVPHLRAGRVVVCDRFTLDVTVALRLLYGHRLAPSAVRLLGGLIRALAPSAARSYFLDVPLDMVTARSPGQFDLRRLSARAGHYSEESQSAGSRRVDGSRRREEVCEELAHDAWEALP